MTQQLVSENASAELAVREDGKRVDKKQVNLQELVESLKSAADDVGQISELSSEEKLLVSEFFASLLKIMQPLTSSIGVSKAAVVGVVETVDEAFLDPTGHLSISFADGSYELKDLSAEKNRDLLVSIIGDVVPKIKSLTAAQKRKIENRIKFLSTVTKEIQKSADALSNVTPG